MSNTKAIINFSRYKAGKLGPDAQIIHDKMTANVLTFPAPALGLSAFQSLISTYDQKLADRASRAAADVLALKTARAALLEALRVLGHYVNGIAKGDPVIVEKSGFPSYATRRAPDTAPPAAPANLRLRHGKLPGAIVARHKPARSRSTNEVQCTTGDPNNEADWHTKGMFQGGRAELDGLTPGTVVWVRVRTVGLKGVMGAWSDPAQIRVL